MNHFSTVIIIIFFIALGFISCGKIPNDFRPLCSKGVIDLTNMDINHDVVKLDGEWEFYWNKLLTPDDFLRADSLPSPQYIETPGGWNNFKINEKKCGPSGYATYRIKIIHPLRDVQSGIHIHFLRSNHRMWIDGTIVSKIGNPSSIESDNIHSLMPTVVYYEFSKDTSEMVLQVANYTLLNGGMRRCPIVGLPIQIQRYRERSIAIWLFMAGAYAIMAFYHFALYFRRRKDLSTLWFGMLCTIMTILTLIVGEIYLMEVIPFIPFEIDLKIRFIIVYIATLLCALFIQSLFRKEISIVVSRIFNSLCIVVILITITFKHNVYITFFPVFLVFTFLYICYVVAIQIRSTIKKQHDALLVLVGVCIISLGGLNDVVSHYSIAHHFNSYLTPFLGLLLLLSQNYMLSRRYAKINTEIIRAGQLASLGELAAGVAHEITTPINAIINFAQILSDSARKQQCNPEFPGRIVREGRRIDVIVKSLLKFGKAVKKVKVPGHLIDVVNETLILTGTQLRKDNIAFSLNVPDTLPVISMNFQEMQQVFVNCISNSRYALNERFGQGAHSDKKITISANVKSYDANSLQIVFHDNGCGISTADLAKIGNPFFTTKPEGKGTGLGLSLSYGIIADHGGTLKITSKINEYTDIIITLPTP